MLLVGHAVADFALQTSAMFYGKDRNILSDYDNAPKWQIWLSAHSLIHGGAVMIVTGSLWFALAEVILHWVIDFAKCEGWTNPQQDQLLHIVCKAGYAVI